MCALIQFRRPVACLVAAAFLSGCGLVFNGTRQNIQANSTPDAAQVTTSPPTGEFTTPVTLELERKRSYSLRFERTGYTPATVEIKNRLQAGYVVLDILFGLVPVIVDAATGAWYKLEPGAALVAMTRLAEGDGPDTIHVGLTLTRDRATGLLELTADQPGVTVRVEAR